MSPNDQVQATAGIVYPANEQVKSTVAWAAAARIVSCNGVTVRLEYQWTVELRVVDITFETPNQAQVFSCLLKERGVLHDWLEEMVPVVSANYHQ
jgi:hypothetical protein